MRQLILISILVFATCAIQIEAKHGDGHSDDWGDVIKYTIRGKFGSNAIQTIKDALKKIEGKQFVQDNEYRGGPHLAFIYVRRPRCVGPTGMQKKENSIRLGRSCMTVEKVKELVEKSLQAKHDDGHLNDWGDVVKYTIRGKFGSNAIQTIKDALKEIKGKKFVEDNEYNVGPHLAFIYVKRPRCVGPTGMQKKENSIYLGSSCTTIEKVKELVEKSLEPKTLKTYRIERDLEAKRDEGQLADWGDVVKYTIRGKFGSNAVQTIKDALKEIKGKQFVQDNEYNSGPHLAFIYVKRPRCVGPTGMQEKENSIYLGSSCTTVEKVKELVEKSLQAKHDEGPLDDWGNVVKYTIRGGFGPNDVQTIKDALQEIEGKRFVEDNEHHGGPHLAFIYLRRPRCVGPTGMQEKGNAIRLGRSCMTVMKVKEIVEKSLRPKTLKTYRIEGEFGSKSEQYITDALDAVGEKTVYKFVRVHDEADLAIINAGGCNIREMTIYLGNKCISQKKVEKLVGKFLANLQR